MPATEDGTGYYEETILVTMNFGGKQQGLWVRTREPSADEWKEQIVPLLGRTEEPLLFVNIFISLLDSWNLKRKDGQAVPCTLAGLMSHNIRLVNKILKAWMNNGILIVEAEEEEVATQSEEDVEEIDPFEGRGLVALDMPTDAAGVKAAS